MITNNTARVIRELPEGGVDHESKLDPALDNPGTYPPGYGRMLLPHGVTFIGQFNTISRTYRSPDEAMQNSEQNARFMRQDVGILECLGLRKRSVALLDWDLVPPDENSPDQKELCNQLRKIIEDIPWWLKYMECLLDAVWYGNACNQQRYQWRTICGQSRVALTRWLPIHPDKLVWRVEDDAWRTEEEVGIRVGMQWKPNDKLPNGATVELTERGMAYFLSPYQRRLVTIHKHEIEDGLYDDPWSAGRIHGVGIRSRVYWEWFQKQELLAFMMEYLERSAFGVELWYYPMGNDQARQATEAAATQRIGNGRNIAIVPRPLGEEQAYGVDHFEPGLGGIEALKSILVEYFGHRIKRLILGQTLTSEAESTGLGSNLASVHLGTFMDIVKYDATNLEETITRDLIDWLRIWNFPAAKDIPVKFKLLTETPDVDSKLGAYEKAWKMGARISEREVMDAIGAALPTGQDWALSAKGSGPMEVLTAQSQQVQAMEAMGSMMGGMPPPGGPPGDPSGGPPSGLPGQQDDQFGSGVPSQMAM